MCEQVIVVCKQGAEVCEQVTVVRGQGAVLCVLVIVFVNRYLYSEGRELKHFSNSQGCICA